MQVYGWVDMRAGKMSECQVGTLTEYPASAFVLVISHATDKTIGFKKQNKSQVDACISSDLAGDPYAFAGGFKYPMWAVLSLTSANMAKAMSYSTIDGTLV